MSDPQPPQSITVDGVEFTVDEFHCIDERWSIDVWRAASGGWTFHLRRRGLEHVCGETYKTALEAMSTAVRMLVEDSDGCE